MNVLGLHGVYPRSHDASASLIIDGEITAFAEEERFVRSKRAFDQQPYNAINYCLEASGLNVNDLDVITYGWRGDLLSPADILPENLQLERSGDIPVVQIPHHEAHAASVFYTSPFESAAVLVIDGQGEEISTSIWSAGADGLRQLETKGVEDSLGYLYGAVSNFCGLGSFGAGKVMGLAPYGEPKYKDLLAEIFDELELPPQTGFDSQDIFFKTFLGKIYANGFTAPSFSYKPNPDTKALRKQPIITDIHRDMAASVQALVEDRIVDLAQTAKRLTGEDNLCMAGGVAMNCVANSVVQDSEIFNDLFVQPACEDCGVAMGSALAVIGKKVSLTPYQGPSFSDEEIESTLTRLGVSHTTHTDVSGATAELIANDVVVGWFQGRTEFGPRALGNRSILAKPRTAEMRDRVNNIKQREPWRPFGPSVTEESAPQLFENARESRYMLRSFTVRQAAREALGATVHVDGSTRPQTVTPDLNQRYYDLLVAVGDKTDVPAVLNTSFNGHDEPIVNSPIDALRTFSSSGLGALIMGNHIITK